MELVEIGLRDHERVAKATKVGGVLQFFGKDVCTINNAWDVLDVNMSCDLCFADTVFTKVDMLDTFGSDCG